MTTPPPPAPESTPNPAGPPAADAAVDVREGPIGRGRVPAVGRSIGVRLSVMMLLQYAVWGVWLPYLSSYLQKPVAEGGLGFSGAQVSWILGLAVSIGAVAAPFIAGQVADRYLNAERALAFLLLAGGVLNLLLARVHGYAAFLLVSVLYSVVYMPTLSLSNSLAFQNLDDPEKKFPPIRLWGTVGWFVASTAFTTLWLVDSNPAVNTARIADALTVSGVISIAYAAYAFFGLPKTPPRRNAREPLAFAKAFGLLRNPAFLVVTLVALPIAMIHQVYFFRAAPFFEAVGVRQSNLGPVLGIGQASEALFLLVLSPLIKRTGYKFVLVLGCLGYAARFGVFAVGHPAGIVIAAQVLHGLCYGCFFAGSFLFVEKVAGDDIRHSAQTVFGIIILGVGPILAGVYSQTVLGRFETKLGTGAGDGVGVVVHYSPIWATQAGIALAAAGVLAVAFRYRPARHGHAPTAARHHGGRLS